MGGSRPLRSESKTSRLLEPQLVAPKKRKMAQRVVIAVQMEANNIKQKNEGPPSDCWSWRKYGQKPIKGSPYPRGYYKCSTSKGCSAKKQVERSSTDASLFIVTYTSTHNHPGPKFPSPNSNNEEPDKDSPDNPVTQDQEPTMDRHVPLEDNDDLQSLHYCKSPFNSSSISQGILVQQEENSFTDNLGTISYDDLPLSYPQQMDFPKSDLSEENDFYDELGELQLPPSSTSFTGIFEEAILVDSSY